MGRRASRAATVDLAERERRIRNCKDPDCLDGFRIRTEEKMLDVTSTGLDGKVTHQRLVKTRFASPCPTCNPDPRQATQEKAAEAARQKTLLEDAADARRSAGE